MTEPTEAQIKEACEKANALIRTIVPPNVLTKISVDPKTSYIDDAFVRLVIEHEAFRQRVSEIAENNYNAISLWHLHGFCGDEAEFWAKDLQSLILPDPTPTPEQVLEEVGQSIGLSVNRIRDLHQALAKRGHHVAPIKDTRHD